MKVQEGAWRRWQYVKTLHRCLSSPFLQRINDPFLEDTPIVEGFDPKEVNQGKKFFDFVLTVTEISNLEQLIRYMTYIGVPVRHQRWLPSSAKQAFALLVDRFLIVCASSVEYESPLSNQLTQVERKRIPNTILHHFTSNNAFMTRFFAGSALNSDWTVP